MLEGLQAVGSDVDSYEGQGGAPNSLFAAYAARMGEDLIAAVTEALATLRAETEHDVQALLGDHVLDDVSKVSGSVGHALGVIEGAGVALGLTALELLEALQLAEDDS
jgi:hypothetical protein